VQCERHDDDSISPGAPVVDHACPRLRIGSPRDRSASRLPDTQLEQSLKGRRYPSLRIGSQVVEGEDHFTVFPILVGRGLLQALPGFGPYVSG
jgi:hypothetical protein